MRLFDAWQAAVTIVWLIIEDPVRQFVVGRNCQAFSIGLSSGDLGGSGSQEKLSGRRSFSVVYQPAWSSPRTACAFGAKLRAISSGVSGR